ncbi:MAG: U32 family peptidase [Patescibacteria group bacterium]
MIEFSLATSWDDQLIREISRLNKKYSDRRIVEVYGSFRTSMAGSARPPWRLPDVSEDQAIRHMQCIHEHGLKFNYVLNAPVIYGEPGKTRSDLISETTRFIDWLQNTLRVDSITVAIPTIARLIKEKFPTLKLIISVVADVHTLERAKKFEKIGADLIYLNAHTANRDFSTIRKIASGLNCAIGLYANISCLDHCPYRKEHYKFFGAVSQTFSRRFHGEVIKDPFYALCMLIYLREPFQLLKAPFIRPEDIGEYHKMGVNIFKLSDRSDSTATLIRTAEAYLSGEFHGNLFEFIFRKGKKMDEGFSLLTQEEGFAENPLVIDNDQLTALSFFSKISQLRGQKLDDFCRAALVQCSNLK